MYSAFKFRTLFGSFRSRHGRSGSDFDVRVRSFVTEHGLRSSGRGATGVFRYRRKVHRDHWDCVINGSTLLKAMNMPQLADDRLIRQGRGRDKNEMLKQIIEAWSRVQAAMSHGRRWKPSGVPCAPILTLNEEQ